MDGLDLPAALADRAAALAADLGGKEVCLICNKDFWTECECAEMHPAPAGSR